MKILLAVVFIVPLLLIPLMSGCGSEEHEKETNTSAPADQDENTSSDSLDERVEELAAGDVEAGERVPGEVIVRLHDGITEEEAYQIFTAHGFERQDVEKRYTPQLYLLHFSEEVRDIESVIRELLLDPNVVHATSNLTVETMD